jgi:hypothetical protein
VNIRFNAAAFPAGGTADLGFRSAAFSGLWRSPAAELGTNSKTADPKTGSALQAAKFPAVFQPPAIAWRDEAAPFAATNDEPRTTNAVLRMKLLGANPHAKVIGLEELPGKSNYFIGNDPKK